MITYISRKQIKRMTALKKREKNHERGITCNITARPTDQAIYTLGGNWCGESFLNIVSEIHAYQVDISDLSNNLATKKTHKQTHKSHK